MLRRTAIKTLAVTTFGTSLLFKNDHATAQEQIISKLQDIETRAQGRLGVHIVDMATQHEYGYRSNELFMMLSSFKWLASALVLARVDRGVETLNRKIRFSKKDLIPWSPLTELHADGDGLTLAQLCHATITTSDNTAGNLILKSYGGPKALTDFARQLGDSVTRLDRYEPELNVAVGTEPLDTTSPRAMANNLQHLLWGSALSAVSRQLLQEWMLANTTGGKRLKAGLPSNWQIGDKTGTNTTDSNDVGFLLPPGNPPILVTAYLVQSQASSPIKDAAIAEVAKLTADILR